MAVKKIAILRRNGFGDLLCSFPLVLYIKKKFQGAPITLFVDERNAPLLPFLPPVDHSVVIPARGNKYWNHLRVAFAHRHHFDLAISAKTSPMKLANLFLYGLKAKQRIAYVDESWHARLINSPLRLCTAQKRHQALKGLHTIAPHLEEVPEELYPKAHVPEGTKLKYPVQKAPRDMILFLSVTTTKSSNRLHVERYASLVNTLYRDLPFSVWIVGQMHDRGRAEALASHLHMPYLMHFPRHFDAFMVLLEAADLIFVGDGGAAHIGAALGKDVVVLFGETDPDEWRPLSKKAEVLYHPHHVDCIEEERVLMTLKKKIEEMDCGRDNL